MKNPSLSSDFHHQPWQPFKACWRVCCVPLVQVNPVDCIPNTPTAFWMCARLGSSLIYQVSLFFNFFHLNHWQLKTRKQVLHFLPLSISFRLPCGQFTLPWVLSRDISYFVESVPLATISATSKPLTTFPTKVSGYFLHFLAKWPTNSRMARSPEFIVIDCTIGLRTDQCESDLWNHWMQHQLGRSQDFKTTLKPTIQDIAGFPYQQRKISNI